jgi:uridine phosphorylase
MSIIHTFDDQSNEILTPNHIANVVDGFPEVVITVFNQKIIDIAKALFDWKEVSDMDAAITIPVYQFDYKTKSVGLYMSTLGGPASVGLLEEIIAKGARKVIVFGSCGVLDRNLVAGHIIVPTAAYRDEGTSYHYMAAGDYVEISTAKRLCELLDEIKISYICGKTWTTDAFYRETKNNMDARKKDGCITVEMECASLMAASQFRNIELYQFLYAEDSLDGECWDSRTMGKVTQGTREKYLRIALEIATRI